MFIYFSIRIIIDLEKNMRIAKKNKNVFIIVIILAITLLGLAGYTAYAHQAQLWPFTSQKTTTESKTSNNKDPVNYNPPTVQEIDSSQDGKKNSQDSAGTTPKIVNFVVSYAGLSDNKSAIEIDAYTPSIIEGNGTCVATLTNGSSIVTGESKAMIDASTSICEPILIPLSKFNNNGTWQVITTYKSPDYSGTSQTVNVEVVK